MIRSASRDCMIAAKASAGIAAPFVAEEQGAGVGQDLAQLEPGQRRAVGGDRQRQRVAAHQGRDRQAQLVEPASGRELAQPGRPALAEDDVMPPLGQLPQGLVGLDPVVAGDDDLRRRPGLPQALRVGRRGVMTSVRLSGAAAAKAGALQSRRSDRVTTASGGAAGRPAA